MEYIKFEIVRPLYSLKKKIGSPNLKVGDRFILDDSNVLFFKTNSKPKDGKYLCCNETGELRWLDEKMKVKKINGVVYSLEKISAAIKSRYEQKIEQQ